MSQNGDEGRDLIHDWNQSEPASRPDFKVMLDDETLRDGLQGPSVVDPPIATKQAILRAMDRLGIDTADVGLPGAGPRAVADVTALCRTIVDERLALRPNCAARTVVKDIEPIAAIAQATGIPIEACLFIGSSAIRQYAEGWDLDLLLQRSDEAVRFAVREGLPVMFVTEDTTRARPETLRRLYTTALAAGARRLCVTDTVGHATPAGVRAVIRFVRSVAADAGIAAGVDWHGHRDRGLDIPNVLAAIEAGADRVHGCGLGIGERAGNAAMELILVNLKLLGWIDRDLGSLPEYCRLIAAFETGTGVHAAAVIKALRKRDTWLADRVYSGVPASEVGRRQSIVIGPLSGKSNVIFWLEERGLEPKDEIVTRIYDAAKKSDRVLAELEIEALIASS
jgi:2-isopropylmalate synthase